MSYERATAYINKGPDGFYNAEIEKLDEKKIELFSTQSKELFLDYLIEKNCIPRVKDFKDLPPNEAKEIKRTVAEEIKRKQNLSSRTPPQDLEDTF